MCALQIDSDSRPSSVPVSVRVRVRVLVHPLVLLWPGISSHASTHAADGDQHDDDRKDADAHINVEWQVAFNFLFNRLRRLKEKCTSKAKDYVCVRARTRATSSNIYPMILFVRKVWKCSVPEYASTWPLIWSLFFMVVEETSGIRNNKPCSASLFCQEIMLNTLKNDQGLPYKTFIYKHYFI